MGVRRFTSAVWWTRSGAVRGSAAAIGAGLLLAPLAGLSGCNGNSAPASAGRAAGGTASRLISTGKVTNSGGAALGIAAHTAVTADGQPAGVAIATVKPGGPAASAGLRAGDVIITANGEQTPGLAKLTAILAATKPGKQLQVTFVRTGTRHTVTVSLVTLQS